MGLYDPTGKINGIESIAINLPRACLFFTQKAGDDEEDANYFDNQGRTLFLPLFHFFLNFSTFVLFIFIHALALVTIFLNNLSCICIFFISICVFYLPCSLPCVFVFLCNCVIVYLCFCTHLSVVGLSAFKGVLR